MEIAKYDAFSKILSCGWCFRGFPTLLRVKLAHPEIFRVHILLPRYDLLLIFPAISSVLSTAKSVERSIRQRGFYNHISSPLLLYRLNILAGELKEVTSDHYKNSWDMTFHHLDGASTLRLWDSKGRARAVFSGLKEAQGDALEFINFLTRFKFPHTYYGVISGTVA